MSYLDIIDDIAAHSGRLDKEALVGKYKDDPIFKSIFHMANEPYINFGVIVPKNVGKYDTDSKLEALFGESKYHDAMFHVLNRLSYNEVTGYNAHALLRRLFDGSTAEIKELTLRILNKDMRCGVSHKTLNKVFGKGFVFEYPIMLCDTLDDKTLKNITFPAICQKKMDAARSNIHVNGDKISVYTRNGKPLDVITDKLRDECLELRKTLGYDFVLDGEAICVDVNGKYASRKFSNGIINKAVHATISEEEKTLVRFVVWDLVMLSEFNEQRGIKIYQDRFGELTAAILFNKTDTIRLVESTIVNTIDEVDVIYKKYVSSGEEGVILKNRNSYWENKRSKYNLKIKEVLEADVKVIDWHLGEGKYSNVLGALTCTDKSGKVIFNVGSGFTDEDRETINKDIIGKIISVKYNALIQDKKTKKHSLFLPIYVETRFDKTDYDLLI